MSKHVLQTGLTSCHGSDGSTVPCKNSGQDGDLPTINELESLVDASSSSPALPDNHPFQGVQEAYWSSTTSFFETDWAYVLYLHKGAVGVGYKRKRDFAIWPVMDTHNP